MNQKIKELIDPKLYDSFMEISKQDIIFQSVLNKSNNIPEFINALIAALVCTVDAQIQFSKIIKEMVAADPKLQEIITKKYDQFTLSPKENP